MSKPSFVSRAIFRDRKTCSPRGAKLGWLEVEIRVSREAFDHEVDERPHSQRLLGSMAIVDVDGLTLGDMPDEQRNELTPPDRRGGRKAAELTDCKSGQHGLRLRVRVVDA